MIKLWARLVPLRPVENTCLKVLTQSYDSLAISTNLFNFCLHLHQTFFAYVCLCVQFLLFNNDTRVMLD